MEIGSFIGLDLNDSGEFYKGDINIARLNSARAGIYHACRLYGCDSIYIPFYLCPTVKRFLQWKRINVIPYNIDELFEPVNINQKTGQAVLLVNFFGILSSNKMKMLANRYLNVIIDNSAAFFSSPTDNCYNVYSPRKFFGVPDGCYVIGNGAEKYTLDYKKDLSSETALFLLKTIELGTNASYKERMENEERIDSSDLLNMSLLTQRLLKNIDYLRIKKNRKKNFHFAHSLYKQWNKLDPGQFVDEECVPLVYPLVVEDPDLAAKFRSRKIYVGRLWNAVLSEVPDNSFEAKLSRYLIPVPVDQRYGEEELAYCQKVFREICTDK